MVKFFHKEVYSNEQYTSYFMWWEKGYVQLENDWKQFLHHKWYNWITFRPIHLHLEVSRCLYRYLEFEFVILGFGIYIQHSLNTDEENETMNNEFDEMMDKNKHCKHCGKALWGDDEDSEEHNDS